MVRGDLIESSMLVPSLVRTTPNQGLNKSLTVRISKPEAIEMPK